MNVPVAKLERIRLQKQSREDLRGFMEKRRQLLKGRVLDYGCGVLQQYSNLVGGDYVGYDPHAPECRRSYEGPFDVVMCNQVLQFVEDPRETLREFFRVLKSGGVLVLTWSSSWYEIEPDDTWRITSEGMRRLLASVGFSVMELVTLTSLEFHGWTINCVYGVTCRKP